MRVKILCAFSDFRNKIPLTARYENMRTIRTKEKLSSTPARAKLRKINIDTAILWKIRDLTIALNISEYLFSFIYSPTVIFV